MKFNIYKHTKHSTDESENNFTIIYVQASSLWHKPLIMNGFSLPSHLSSEGAILIQRQQSELRLMLGEAQRKRTATQPLLSLPGPRAVLGERQRAGPLWASVQETLLFAPVLLLQMCLFLPAIQQPHPCWWCWSPPCWHMTLQGSHSASRGVRMPVLEAGRKQHTSSA